MEREAEFVHTGNAALTRVLRQDSQEADEQLRATRPYGAMTAALAARVRGEGGEIVLPTPVARTRWRRQHAERVARSVGGALFFAGEATAEPLEPGTVHGARRSGERAAMEIGAMLAGR